MLTIAAACALIVGLILTVGRNPAAPLSLQQAANATPQLATLQGTSCTRSGANAEFSGTVQNETVAPITANILVATGNPTTATNPSGSMTAKRVITLNFSGGVLGASNLPWQVSLPVGNASSCYVYLKAVLNIP